MIDGAGNRLRDIGSGNTLSNRQVDSYIVLRSTPSSIGIEIAGTGENLYDYRSNVKQSGDRGYEDFIDDDYNDAVILIAPISCSAQGSPPQQYVYIPPGGSNPPQTDLSIRTPVVSSVSADSITATSARAVVAISDHDGSELTVRLRYQQKAESQDWTTDVSTAEATGSASPATKQLQGLSPGTEYVLQASLDDAFPADGTKETAFTTRPLPSIQSVSVGNIGQTSARATVSIANPDGSAQTVKLRYRTDKPAGTMEPARKEQHGGERGAGSHRTDGGHRLRSCRLGSRATKPDKETATFTTSQSQPRQQRSLAVREPSISLVNFINIMQTSAVASVSLRHAGAEEKTVRLRYRASDASKWSAPKTATTKGSGTTIPLTGLTASTTYKAQVWLTGSSPPSGARTYTFTTLDVVVPDPSISALEFEGIGQTSATAVVKVADAGAEMKEVYLKYRIDGSDEWTTLPSPSTTSMAIPSPST